MYLIVITLSLLSFIEATLKPDSVCLRSTKPTREENMSSVKQPKITDSEVAHIQTLREMTEVLKARLEKLENELEANESQVIDLLENGATNDSSFNISVNETSRRYPKYKEELEKRLAENVLNQIIESTEAKISKKLVIAA